MKNKYGYFFADEDIEPESCSTPPVPPRRKEKRRHTPPRPISNGLPPTPKVHMGACFSKVKIIMLEIKAPIKFVF